MDSGKFLLPYSRSRYTPLKLEYPIAGLMTLAITGTECIANRQIDRWESVICSSCALRRPSLPLPLHNHRQLHSIIIGVKFQPNPSSPSTKREYVNLCFYFVIFCWSSLHPLSLIWHLEMTSNLNKKSILSKHKNKDRLIANWKINFKYPLVQCTIFWRGKTKSLNSIHFSVNYDQSLSMSS